MGVVEIAQEEIDGFFAVRLFDFLNNLLRDSSPHGQLFMRKTVRHVHEPARRQEVDSRFNNFISQFLKSRMEVAAPQIAIEILWVEGMPYGCKDSHGIFTSS